MEHNPNNKECPQNNCGQFTNCNNYACEGENSCICQKHECECPDDWGRDGKPITLNPLNPPKNFEQNVVDALYQDIHKCEQGTFCVECGRDNREHEINSSLCFHRVCEHTKPQPTSEGIVNPDWENRNEPVDSPMWVLRQLQIDKDIRKEKELSYTAGLERCLELLPEENTDDVGITDIAWRNRGWNSCRSQAESAIKEEINKI